MLAAMGVVAGSSVTGDPAGASTGAVAPAPTRVVRRLAYIGTIPKAVQREIDTVDSVDDLARISPEARKVVQTPVIEVIEAGKASDAPASYATGTGKVGYGCYLAWVSRKRENVLGWVLLSARTTVVNWCNNGTNITSTPTVQRSMRGRWGWGSCGWDNVFGGWMRDRVRYGAGGDALFALNGACAGAGTKTIHSELQLYGTGRYSWTT